MNLIFDRAYYFSFGDAKNALNIACGNFIHHDVEMFNSPSDCDGEGLDDAFINIASHIEELA